MFEITKTTQITNKETCDYCGQSSSPILVALDLRICKYCLIEFFEQTECAPHCKNCGELINEDKDFYQSDTEINFCNFECYQAYEGDKIDQAEREMTEFLERSRENES